MFTQLYNLVGLTAPQHPIHGQKLWSHISWHLMVRCSVPISIKGAFSRTVEFFCRGHGITSVSQGTMLRSIGLARGSALMWNHRIYRPYGPVARPLVPSLDHCKALSCSGTQSKLTAWWQPSNMQVLAVRRKITGTCVPENSKRIREDDSGSSADSISHKKHKLPELFRDFYNSHIIIINSEDPVFLKASIMLKIREYSNNSNCYYTCINIFKNTIFFISFYWI